jgi:alpha-1,3-rhamnosyl/mannosyltransferase
VITSSEYSRQRVIEMLGVSPERITTIPLGIDDRFTPAEVSDAALEAIGVRRPFILTVGTLQPRKNIEGAIAGFEKFMEAGGEPHQLVIVGARGWRDDELLARVASSSQSDNILITGRVSDEQLIDLYRAAAMFVFPSRYEGFGFPPLEAMACGSPVISSDRTSLAEIVGDAGITIDPDDPAEIGAAIARVAGSPELQADLRARGIAHAATFTWQRTAEQTVGVYKRAIAAAL